MPKQSSSGSRMRKAGYKPVQLWLTEEQHQQIFAAAEGEGRKATQFLIFHGVKAAKTILRNLSK